MDEETEFLEVVANDDDDSSMFYAGILNENDVSLSQKSETTFLEVLEDSE